MIALGKGSSIHGSRPRENVEAEENSESKGQVRDPWKALFLAVVWQAVRERRGFTPGYISRQSTQRLIPFLLIEAPMWLSAAGVDVEPDWWEKWVKARCPRLVLDNSRGLDEW